MNVVKEQSLLSYVPALVTRRLAARATGTTEATAVALPIPEAERFPAAVLFADIAGFTRMVEWLHHSAGEVGGAEQLAEILNLYFSQMIEIITAHGGEVVKFAGDALLIAWTAQTIPNVTSYVADEDLQEVILRATQCALALQERCEKMDVGNGVRLSLQMGIGAGHVFAVHLGGVLGRTAFLLSGDPLVQMSRAEDLAQSGQIVLSPEAWQLVKRQTTTKRLVDDYRLLKQLKTAVDIQPAIAPQLPPSAEPALRGYIPAAVLNYLEAGFSAWRAEIRQVTVLFIHLPSFGTSIKHPYQRTLPQAQAVMEALQTNLYRYEGSINKLNVDDKGITLVAALGLPPFAHRDDPLRGVLAAMDVQQALLELDRPNSIGVTTGQVFCGSIGHPQVCEYTIVGDAVNLASRLMETAQKEKASAPADREQYAIHCDQATYEVARKEIKFDKLAPVTVKGKTKPVALYRPRPENKAIRKIPFRPLNEQRPLPLIGRDQELAWLLNQVDLLTEQADIEPNLVVVEGESGIGKTRLLVELVHRIRDKNLFVLATTGRRREIYTPFYAWQSIFWELFNFHALFPLGLAEQRSKIMRQLPLVAGERGYPAQALQLAPLLNAVLPLNLPDTHYTRKLTGEERRAATHKFLLSLLPPLVYSKTGKSQIPMVFLFDDVHLLDADSLQLLQVAMAQRPSLFIVTTRLLPHDHAVQNLSPTPSRLHLAHLSVADLTALVCQQRRTHALSPSFVELLSHQAEGNPLYAQTITTHLQAGGWLQQSNGVCELPVSLTEIGDLPVPATMREAVVNVVDSLPPRQQLILKVTAVAPELFAVSDLHALLPTTITPAQLTADLDEMVKLHLLHRELRESDRQPTYQFAHRFGHDVVKGLLLRAQRRQLLGE